MTKKFYKKLNIFYNKHVFEQTWGRRWWRVLILSLRVGFAKRREGPGRGW